MRKLIQRVLVVMVLLVPVQLLLHEGAILFGRPWSERMLLLFIAGGLDLVFAVDFIIRLYLSMIRRRGIAYLGAGRGWVDFLGSVPVVVFLSGPFLFGILAGGVAPYGSGALLHPLVLGRLLQSLALLRLLRLHKLFPVQRRRTADMRARHIGRLVLLFLGVTVLGSLAVGLGLAIVPAASSAAAMNSHAELQAKSMTEVARSVGGSQEDRTASLRRSAVVRGVAEANQAVLVLRHAGRTAYTRMSNEYYATQFGPGEYLYGVSGEYAVFLDARPFHSQSAATRLQIMVVAILGVVFIGGVYGRHFATTVQAPLRVIRRGFVDPSYSLPVHIPSAYATDEVFQVADSYNTVVLRDKGGASS